MLRKLLMIQRLKGDARAVSRVPKALGKRLTSERPTGWCEYSFVNASSS